MYAVIKKNNVRIIIVNIGRVGLAQYLAIDNPITSLILSV